MARDTTISLLLVDDDLELCGLMREFLTEQDMKVDAVHDGERGLRRALEGTCDLVILDVMLPNMDGFEVLRQLRKRSAVPVIMLTARTEPADRISGLESGADDYLPKPFSPEELVARIRAVLRRIGKTPSLKPEVLEAADVQLFPRSKEVVSGGELLTLTSIEFEVLEVLMRSAGRVVSRDDLSKALYQRQASPFERSLDVHVSHLRRKLDRGHDLIRTIRGVGYQFSPPPEAKEAASNLTLEP